MKKVVHDNGNTTTTEYAGNYIYENSVLKFFSHPEGYVEPNGVSYEYVYQYKDHLGNIRLSYSDPNDSYQDILDSDLTNSYNGWVHNGVVTSELVNGTLRVDVNSSFEGIKNELPNLTVSPGDVLDISLVFDKGNTLSNVRLYFQELDANGNHVSWNTIDTNLQTGTHSYTYTVNAGNRLTLRIDKDNTNTNSLTSFYVDHVSVTTGALEILEENNYYPFGLKHKGYNDVVNSTNIAQKYKYNGMELNEELGLDWYDYGARNYEASLGRWMNIDPLAYRYDNSSPYSYVFNNPILFVDPDGMRAVMGRNVVDDRKLNVKEMGLLLLAMQNITDDKLTYNGDTGVISILKHGKGDKEEGTKLIRDIIGHKKTLTISYGRSEKFDPILKKRYGFTGEREESVDEEKASNGEGSDTTVIIGNGHFIITQDFETGKFGKERMSPTDLMNHGLIHGLASLNGESKGVPSKAKRVLVTYEDSEGVKYEKISIEEAYTVYYRRPTSKKTGIYPTENILRREQKKPKRVNYGF